MFQKLTYVLLLFFGVGYGQQDRMQSLDFSGGYEPNGFFARITYSRLYDKNLLRASGQYHIENFGISNANQDINATLYLLGLEYYRQLWSYNGRDILLYIGAGATGGLENIKNNQNSSAVELLVADGIIEDTFVYGAHVGAEIEKHLTQLSSTGTSLAVILNVRQYYIVGSVFEGNTMFNASLGLKLNF